MTTDPTAAQIELSQTYLADNYAPLPVVISQGAGSRVVDVQGREFLDCLSGYSALNFGHCHPRLVAAASSQLATLTLTSRAFYNDQLGPFARDLAALCGKDTVLPMNTGVEAVETAIKIARRWGYRIKGVPEDRATIVVMDGNFHGRTTTVISFSSDDNATADFGPYTPGFRSVPFGDEDALAAAIDDTTVAVLLEPIQGEAGVIVPPEGYLAAVRRLTTDNDVLMIADEIQSGLCRTGTTFACDREGVVPDIYVLGKALGGGIVALSAVVGDHDIFDVITPGSHGSTFGGNPLAARVGQEVVSMVAEGTFQARAMELSVALKAGLEPMIGRGVTAVRIVGAWVGLDIDPDVMTGRQLCEGLLSHSILAKDAHGQTVRLAPPLVSTRADIELLTGAIARVVGDSRPHERGATVG